MNNTTDGYHTFDELYNHRATLYISLCKLLKKNGNNVWISIRHSDGSTYDGYFILGINEQKGKQITYHLDIKYWHECKEFAEVIEYAPTYDGHSSEIVLERIKRLVD